MVSSSNVPILRINMVFLNVPTGGLIVSECGLGK